MQALRRILIYEPKNLVGCAVYKRNSTSTLVPKNETIERKNYIFNLEQKRQLEEVGRIEKITVQVSGPENVSLSMNQDISTPYDCCKHISEGLCLQAPLALVNNEILWDMHRPLPGNCTLRFLNFKDEDPFSLNKVFWRTGSFILGAVISKAFKDNVKVYLHSFPPPSVKSGSFVYDVIMNLVDWTPSEAELKILSAEFLSFVHKNHKIERLKVKKSVALEIFEDNPVKKMQLSDISRQSEDSLITLYRVADHIDISCGPMVGDTSFFGRCAVTAVHKINNLQDMFYRFQAVALPKGIMLNSFAFGVLMGRAERLNEALPPGLKDPRWSENGGSGVILPNSKIDIDPNPLTFKFS